MPIVILVLAVYAVQSSFKNSTSVFFHASASDRDRVINGWHQSLTAAFARTQGLRPFEIVFRSLETSPAATFLVGDDASKTVEALRSAIREAARDPVLGELSTELENKYGGTHLNLCSLGDAVQIPNIIHSTVMRVASEVSEERRLAKGLAELSARWEPATVRVGQISLVYENHPYMHLIREGRKRIAIGFRSAYFRSAHVPREEGLRGECSIPQGWLSKLVLAVFPLLFVRRVIWSFG